MSDLYKGKYRVDSTRLRNWDYGSNADYFVTICTYDKLCFFGDIEDDKMKYSQIGRIADQYWIDIPKYYPFVILGAYVIMPNHVHGIITINKKEGYRVYTGNKFGPQTDKLGAIVGGYKAGVTKFAKGQNIDFAWQPSFHDHIIRNSRSYTNISNYIRNNPLNWKSDQFHI